MARPDAPAKVEPGPKPGLPANKLPPSPPLDPLELIIPVVVFLHLFAAPYTKVEESFNLQAAHDIISYGIPFENTTKLVTKYDHFSFPGVVPRTFIGATVLGGLAGPFIDVFSDGVYRQVFVRGILGMYNAYALMTLSRAIKEAHSKGAARWYLVLQASQFHVMFYASRTLPNMFAFGLTTHAISNLVLNTPATTSLGIQLLIFSSIVFRSEIAVYLLTTILPLFFTEQIIIFPDFLRLGLITAGISLLICVPIDTFYWQSWPVPMWAELTGFLFNTVQGKSSEWGTSPIYHYFSNALPKLLLNPMACLLIPMAVRRRGEKVGERLVVPAMWFITLYSLLPHKEWRFIVYAVPALTAAAGIGADWLFTRPNSSLIFNSLKLATLLCVLLSFIASGVMLYVSRLNYPGGLALSLLDQIAGNDTNGNGNLWPPSAHYKPKTTNEINLATIHLDVLTCMTGASRFTQNGIKHPDWRYLKTEEKDVLSTMEFWDNIDYAITSNIEKPRGDFKVVGSVEGYKGVKIIALDGEEEGKKAQGLVVGGSVGRMVSKFVPGKRWAVVRMEEMIWILKRNTGYNDSEGSGKAAHVEAENSKEGHDEL